VKEVATNVFVESSYPPYNLVLIKTEKGGIIVDVPPNPVHALTWIEQARAAGGPLRYVVFTDAGRERQLATAFCEVPVIATETMLRIMAGYSEERARREYFDLLTSRYPEEMGALDGARPRKPAIAFNSAFTLYADGMTLQFEAVEGAAPGSLWLLIPEHSLLIAGDTVVVNVPPAMEATPNSKAWLNTMAGLAHRQTVKGIVPGCGPAWINRGDIESQREFMRVMRRAARTLARKSANGLSLTQTAQELQQTFFNRSGQKAVKLLRAGLERLVAEVVDAEDGGPDDQDETV